MTCVADIQYVGLNFTSSSSSSVCHLAAFGKDHSARLLLHSVHPILCLGESARRILLVQKEISLDGSDRQPDSGTFGQDGLGKLGGASIETEQFLLIHYSSYRNSGHGIEMLVHVGGLLLDCVIEGNVNIKPARSSECFVESPGVVCRGKEDRVFLLRRGQHDC